MDICVVGLPKSGKTSILKVIFQRMGPQYTMMLDPTPKVETITKSFGPLQVSIHDFPGNFDFKDANPPEITLLENCGAMIYIIDVQAEPYTESIAYLMSCLKFLNKINPKIVVKVFLHKTDAESFTAEDRKADTMKQIKESIQNDMDSSGLKNMHIDYHLTTVYDHTLIESFSKVVQKIIPNVSYIVNLLDSLITNCKMEKVFLFEMISKTYLASDSAPVEAQNYAICSDMIDVVIDVSYLYSVKSNKESNMNFDEKTESVIKLANNTILYYKQIEKLLALICLIKDSNFDRPFLIDYNIDIFKQGLNEVFKATTKKK